MVDNKKIQQLMQEIEEIESLLEEWEPSRDPHTSWAVLMLKKCLERRKGNLTHLLH